ncbi:MAG: hypothetical protein WAU36_11275 [Cyclobacteriaceae bacterium]
MTNTTSTLLKIWLVSVLVFCGSNLLAQQVSDLAYDPIIKNPIYKAGTGPIIFIDEGHHNFHTKSGRYAPFAKVIEKDGYQVKSYKGEFTEKKLNEVKILVIVNALNEVNLGNWILPTPSAFTKEEIEIVGKWVAKGGSLFLIADHMPFSGANEDLAAAFGFTFFNGFNINTVNPAYFWRSNGTIAENEISLGRNASETVHKIPNTEGQAFQIPGDAQAILTFDKNSLILLPDTAWVFHSQTPMRNIKGWAQGAFKKHEKGRVVVFGEASMFSAQIGQPGNRKMGMNNEDAPDNYKLLLNTIHWLDGILE